MYPALPGASGSSLCVYQVLVLPPQSGGVSGPAGSSTSSEDVLPVWSVYQLWCPPVYQYMGSTCTGMGNELPVVVHLLADVHTFIYVCDLPVNGMVHLLADSPTFL